MARAPARARTGATHVRAHAVQHGVRLPSRRRGRVAAHLAPSTTGGRLRRGGRRCRGAHPYRVRPRRGPPRRPATDEALHPSRDIPPGPHGAEHRPVLRARRRRDPRGSAVTRGVPFADHGSRARLRGRQPGVRRALRLPRRSADGVWVGKSDTYGRAHRRWVRRSRSRDRSDLLAVAPRRRPLGSGGGDDPHRRRRPSHGPRGFNGPARPGTRANRPSGADRRGRDRARPRERRPNADRGA